MPIADMLAEISSSCDFDQVITRLLFVAIFHGYDSQYSNSYS